MVLDRQPNVVENVSFLQVLPSSVFVILLLTFGAHKASVFAYKQGLDFIYIQIMCSSITLCTRLNHCGTKENDLCGISFKGNFSAVASVSQ